MKEAQMMNAYRMERVDREVLLESFASLAETGIEKMCGQYFDNATLIYAKKAWGKYFDQLDCDTQVEYEQTVLTAFLDYQGIHNGFYWTQGLLMAVQSGLNIPAPVPGLEESEQALRNVWNRFAAKLGGEQRAAFYNYVALKKESIDTAKKCAYLHGFESALTLAGNIGIKVNEEDLEKMYDNLGTRKNAGTF